MQESAITEKKNSFYLNYQGISLYITGNYDSGNLNNASLNLQTNEIELQFGRDRDIKSSKCWFYFSISGNYSYINVKLFLQKINSLNTVAKIYDLYRPVVKVQGGQWQRYGTPVEFQISAENDVSFRMGLELFNSKTVYVALCYPWSVQQNTMYIEQLQKNIAKKKEIYFNKQTLIYSPQNRPLYLLALSSKQVYDNQPQQYAQHLFPNRSVESHYKLIKKPLIMITARVHPSEIGSSYALMGMINFLVSGSVESRKILNQFYFLIIPMLNPDGVYLGNHRMDALGQNLNRFYLFPEVQKQPSCYAVKTLVEGTRLQMYAYFDLHGHSNKKSCFLFGNSINNKRLQIESILFVKYLSMICNYIEFKSCNFSKKQMSSKDKNQQLSKEGCARVVIHKWTNSPYIYTLETGIYKNVKVDDKGIQRYGDQFYNPNIYAQIGQKILISLFVMQKKDKQIQQIRKQVSAYVVKLQKLNVKRQLKLAGVNGKKQGGKQSKEKKQGSKGMSLGSYLTTKNILLDKENQKFGEKNKDVQEILNKNKNYLLSLDDDDDQY